jgi:transcriptional regulator with XRE-family HTH domain
LEEIVEERSGHNAKFPQLVDAATRRRRLLKELAEMRETLGQSQTAVAAKMKSSQSSVARLEGSAFDARLSTIDRYAESLGFQIQWHLLPLEAAAAEPPVIVHDAP